MIRIRQIKLKLNHSEKDIKNKIINILKINDNELLNYKINKQSLDARKKDNIHYVYEIDVSVKAENKILNKIKNKDILKAPDESYHFEIYGNKVMTSRPVIVGSGPAGLFCAYVLAENGYKPLIIERGEKIESRVQTVNDFWEKGILNENSNVQFGEGGAGTFSDGKLNTLVKDKFGRTKKVFETFVSCGANPDILYVKGPHIGTDVLRKVIINMREKIINMGGEFHYNTTLTDLIIKDNVLNGIIVNNNKKIPCETLVLATGHSARDTFEMLNNYLKIESKPFAVGIRISHKQEMIDKNQYGNVTGLPPASYKLTHKAGNHGVYSFCMCPGGFVVNASSEKEKIVINGMSNHKRDEENANSAIVVTVDNNDFGNNPLDGIKFQRTIEKKAYNITNGLIPVQLYKDFKEKKVSTEFGNIKPVFKGKYAFADINKILPYYICESLIEGIEDFDKKIKGFSADDVIIAAPETRTSSPIRIIRDENYQSNIKGIYPCGEGSGYAGGITTSAIDGIKIAEAIAKVYKKQPD